MNLPRLATLPLLLTLSCAQGSVDPGGDAGTRTDRDSSSPGRDVGSANVLSQPDMRLPGTGICTVNETTCIDTQTLGRCLPDQTAYDMTPCSADTTCMDGACVAPPVCTPGEVDCLDTQTVLRCRGTGEGYVQMTCDPPFACAEGMCSDKLPRGAGCTTDDECASVNCRCGSGTDDNCPASLGGGICANDSCVAGGCGASSLCLAADVVPTGGADYDHCVRACDSGNPCPSGSKCVSVPVRNAGGYEFRDACYFTGVKGFGDDCSTAAECLTGACLTGYFDNGFCSRRCDQDGFCSEGSSCVELIAGQFWCTLTCGDGSVVGTDPCPLDVPNDRFDVTCKSLAAQGGGVLRVCAAP